MNEGWKEKGCPQHVKEVSVSHKVSYLDTINTHSDEIQQIVKDLIFYELADKICKSGLITINRHNYELVATMYITKPEYKYYNLLVPQHIFEVEDQQFSNDELVEAVKNYYAERFI